MSKEIDIVIVNWNSGEYLRECVGSINQYARDYTNQIVIVDNGSTDNSAININSLHVQCKVIINSVNLGFSKACNQGYKETSTKYVLFLNPDTLINSRSLECPISLMDQNPGIGICGIRMMDEVQQTSRHCARFPTILTFLFQALGINKLPLLKSYGMHMDDWDHETEDYVDHVIGAFFFVRRQLYDEIDGFDEDYFVYYEDIDFSFRAKKNGWLSYYDPKCNVMHVGGGSSRKVKAQRLAYSLSGRMIFVKKHYGVIRQILLLLIILLIEPVPRMINLLAKKEISEIKNVIYGYLLFWQRIPKLLFHNYVSKN
jgi:GT2 family glycosyltransferase